MPTLFSSARSADTSNLPLVLICLGFAAAAAVLALIPILLITRRRPRNESFTTAVVVWALISLGLACSTAIARAKYADEYTLRLETGYLDPADTSDAPQFPMRSTAALTTMYVALLVYSLTAKPTHRPVTGKSGTAL